MLHLVDDLGRPVSNEIQNAVEIAFRRVARQFSRLDQAILAEFAESVAASMSRRFSEIHAPKQYARIALKGRVQEWFRANPNRELIVDRVDELEQAGGPTVDRPFSEAETEILFSQIKKHLSERERHILVLMEQDLGPGEIGAALGLSYNAAAKAIQRVKEHIASLVAMPAKSSGERRGFPPRSSQGRLG